MKKLVSIIIPIFNNRETLHFHLKSLINQTYKNIEIIIVDNYSTDTSLKIVQYYAKKDNRIKIYSNMSKNLVDSYKYGISKSSGKYIYISSPEIILSQNFIEYGIIQLEYFNSTIFTCNYFLLPEQKLKFLQSIIFNKSEKETLLQDTNAYLNMLYTKNKEFLIKTLCLPNKIFDKTILDTPLNYSNIYLYANKLLKQSNTIVNSPQILLAKITIDKYFSETCYDSNDFLIIEFLEDLLIKAKKQNKTHYLEKTSTLLLNELLFIRKKLSFYYLEIDNQEQLKNKINSKFSSINKFLKHINLTSPSIQKTSEAYEKILNKDKAIKLHPFLYI